MESMLKDNIFEFAYEMAMRDATLQRAYYEDGLTNEKKHLLECENAKTIVKGYIKSILEGSDTLCFYKTERSVEEAFEKHHEGKDYARFTFGNTQKLINMTAKYFFISCYYDPALLDRFKKCHCPMDSKMIEIVIQLIEDYSIEDEIEKRAKEFMKTDGVSMTWRAYLRQSWSNIGKEDKERIGQYKFFQEIVGSLGKKEEPNLSPIEFDYKYWK